mgnify:CR=1 FL=1
MDSSQKENQDAVTENTELSYEKETMRCTEKHIVFVADGQLLMIGMSVLWRGIEARIKLIESDDGKCMLLVISRSSLVIWRKSEIWE